MRKNILISGSSRGLGKELTQILRSQGYNVFTMGYSTDVPVDLRVDLSNGPDTKKLLKKFFDKNNIDILVCNAGTGKRPQYLESTFSLSEYFEQKNYVTAKNLVEACMPYLKEKSSIIAISSIVALKSMEGAPKEYAASKLKLNSYIKKLALQCSGRDIRCNIISLGNVFFYGSRWEEISIEKPIFVQELLENVVPLHRFISPDEIAYAIIYLSSELSRNITGMNLIIDGGQSL